MLLFLKDNFANPSSTPHFSQCIKEKVKQACEQIADFINSELNELIFSSGATKTCEIIGVEMAANQRNISALRDKFEIKFLRLY